MLDALYFVDRNGIVVDVNRGACAQLGYEHDELVGTRMTVHIADPTFAFDSFYARVVSEGHSSVETELAHKSGTAIPVEVSVSRVIMAPGLQKPPL